MEGGRNLGDVLDKLKTLMPAQYHRSIDWFADAIKYRAPERESASWNEVQVWLFTHLGVGAPPLKIAAGDEWKADALALWADKDVAQMCAEGLFEFSEEIAQ